MSTDGARRSLVVMGASAGGVEALTEVVRALPSGLPAAVAIVLHVPPLGRSVLPAILNRAGNMPARAAIDGDPLTSGCVYVAPPDQHLLVEDATLLLRR